jgi:serine/threonine protein kinase
MAPELAEQPESASSDIYALGVLLYQMLTGRLPFSGTSPLAICLKHLKEQPVPPTRLNPDIPHPIERVILRAMHKNPRLRFTEAGALSLAYANALSGIDEMPDLDTLPSLELPVLPPIQVTLRKVGKGFAAGLPGHTRHARLGSTIRRGVVSIAALFLLALPVSLGVILAHTGTPVNQPLAINRVFVNQAMAARIIPPVSKPLPPVVHTNQAPAQPNNANQEDQDGHGHKHKHKHHDV